MSEQQAAIEFVPVTPVARDTDPKSSHLSARRVTRSGERKRQADEVLAAVRRWPGRTSAEIAALMGEPRAMPARRLPEIEDSKNGGLVKRGEMRHCRVSEGSPLSLTWWPALPADQSTER